MSKSCTLHITDEVNVRITGLDARDRRDLHHQFSYEIPGARYLPAVKLGRWNGKVPYFSLGTPTGGSSTFINLLSEIIPILDERGYDVELNDARDYSTNFEFTAVDENTFAHKTWPVGHPAAGQPIALRDYQVSVINHFLSNPQCIQVAPTGSGKTIITAALSSSVESYGRSIVIVPNKSLVTQTEVDYRNLGLEIGVYFGDRKEIGKKHTICTWQSILSLIKKSHSGETDFTINDFLDDVICVIVDECFDGDSLVLTPTGYVPIKMIQPGDTVINYSETTGEFKEDIVIKRHENLTKSSLEKMYEMEFDNGSKIKVTGNHKFLTNLGWVRADSLNENHEIVSTNINT